MKELYGRIAEEACCAGCPTEDTDGTCMYRQQGDCDRLAAAVEAVGIAPIWGNYLVAPRRVHVHFYVEAAEACKKLQAKARRRLEDLIRKDCSLCESVLKSVGLPIE